MLDLEKYNFKEIVKYAVYNDDGFLIGVKDDAPQKVKDSYQLFQQVHEKAKKQGVKL